MDCEMTTVPVGDWVPEKPKEPRRKRFGWLLLSSCVALALLGGCGVGLALGSGTSTTITEPAAQPTVTATQTATQTVTRTETAAPAPQPTVTATKTSKPVVKTVTKQVTPTSCLKALDSADT